MNYYAYSGKGSLEESFKYNVKYTTFKTSVEEMAIKISKRNFGGKDYSLFSFTDFNNINTFTQIK